MLGRSRKPASARCANDNGQLYITVITYGKMVKHCMAAAQELLTRGIDIEIIDLRSLLPLDVETILLSVEKTKRAAIVHEAPLTAGMGAEIAAIIAEKAFHFLEGPVKRIAGLDVPMPFAPVLENFVIPSTQRISEELISMLV